MRLEILSEDRGYEQTIVFVHGAYHAAWCWKEHFFSFFSENGFNVYALSLTGHGNSTGKEELNSKTFKDYAEDLKMVVDRCKKPPIVIAHSMGATVVYEFLRYYPQKIHKMVYLAPTPVKNMIKSTFLYYIHNRGRRNTEIFFDGQVSGIEEMKYGNLIDMGESIKVKLQLLFSRCKPELKIKIPTLTIGSWSDKVMLTEDIFQQADYFKSKLIMVDDICHDMMLSSKWKCIAEYILSFLQQSVEFSYKEEYNSNLSRNLYKIKNCN